MKISKLLLCICCVSQCLTFSSCDWFPIGCGGDNYSISISNILYFHILDKHTKQNLFIWDTTPYDYAITRILYSDMTPVPGQSIGTNGLLYFGYITQPDKGKANQLISRRFIMHLTETDNDTIDIDFNTKFNNCHDQLLKYIKISYNDSVYYEGPAIHDSPPNVDFLKQQQ